MLFFILGTVDKVNPRTGISDCPARAAAGYCKRKYYIKLMKEQCPVSCGYASSESDSNSVELESNSVEGLSF